MIIYASFCLSLCIMGLYGTFRPGMVFNGIKETGDYVINLCGLPYWLSKPFYSCPACMASFWGLVFYGVYGKQYLTIVEMCLVMLATSFLNYFWCCLLDKISDYGC